MFNPMFSSFKGNETPLELGEEGQGTGVMMVGLLAKKFHFQMRVTRGGVEEVVVVVVVVLVLRTLRHQQRLFHVGNIISSSSNNNNFYF